MHNNLALTNEQLFETAPSIFADKPFIGMSEQYKFIPTIEVIDNLRNEGFFPVLAGQSRTRCLAKQGLPRHIVKFREEKHLGDIAVKGAEVPEIVLVNSHDGSSLYELMMGIFRYVCSNGNIVQSDSFGSYSVKHNGVIQDLIETTYKIVADFPKAFAQIEAMKAINLNPVQQLTFAEKAMVIKFPETKEIDTKLILNARREDDETINGDRDLWTTFNVIQENIIKGGLEGSHLNTTTNKTRKTKTRPIKAVQEDLRVNKALWQLTTDYLPLAA